MAEVDRLELDTLATSGKGKAVVASKALAWNGTERMMAP